MTTMNTTDQPRAVACIRFVRLCADSGKMCRHSRSSGYAFWCAKEGCECTRGGAPKQEGCYEEPNDEMRDRPDNATPQTQSTTKPE
jgi:hypothetical protein